LLHLHKVKHVPQLARWAACVREVRDEEPVPGPFDEAPTSHRKIANTHIH